LLKALVSRVKRRIDIRIVKFCRSTNEVLTASGRERRSPFSYRTMHFEGL
jgi:hypothetical protein